VCHVGVQGFRGRGKGESQTGGLKHLWDCQIDADLECDALGWQYVSGCLSGVLWGLCVDTVMSFIGERGEQRGVVC
jgi:hypothetical protein